MPDKLGLRFRRIAYFLARGNSSLYGKERRISGPCKVQACSRIIYVSQVHAKKRGRVFITHTEPAGLNATHIHT